jgi:hypothetical protein
LILARLDPDGNEISTDEEEVAERARTITRRNNPQPFFNLFRPDVRASSDGTATPRDDTNTSEAQTPTQSDHMDATESSYAKVEVCGFTRSRGGMSTDELAN